MVQFIDEHQTDYGVEPICRVLPIAPSTYYLHKTHAAHAEKRSARAQRDDRLRPEIQRVYDESQQVYGAKKMWKQLNREAIPVARCTVVRLMRQLALRGAVRGRAWTHTTIAEPAMERPSDLVERRCGNAAESALGRGSHVRGHVARVRVRRVRHRRLLAAHRRLARVDLLA